MHEIYFYDANLLITAKVSPLNGDIIRELEPLSDVCSIMLHEGDLELPELLVGKDIIIVNGNLTVTGNIEDCKGVDTSLLIVLGNVTCKNLITLSGIFITGNLHVENAILGDSLCDHGLKVEGDLKARTILNGGHFFQSLGTTTADHIMNSNGSVRDKNGVLKPNLADSDLMEDFTDNPASYEGFSYVELIDDVQKSNQYSLPLAVKLIRQGSEVFHKS